MEQIPKKIWIYWHQGFYDAPLVIKKCLLSWQLHHRNYEVNFLDKNSVTEYIKIPSFYNLDRKDMTIQEYSNFIRLSLLRTYGGIWVDSTIYCYASLDTWLNKYLKEGIFIFRNSFQGRLTVNWFIASVPNHYIITTWLYSHEKYFRNNYLSNTHNKFGKRAKSFFGQFLNKDVKRTQIWLTFFFTKVFKVYPYFIAHYVFNQCYLRNKLFRDQWDKTIKLSSRNHDLLFIVSRGLSFDNYLKLYNENKVFMIKLSHRISLDDTPYKDFYGLINKDFKMLKNSEPI